MSNHKERMWSNGKTIVIEDGIVWWQYEMDKSKRWWSDTLEDWSRTIEQAIEDWHLHEIEEWEIAEFYLKK